MAFLLSYSFIKSEIGVFILVFFRFGYLHHNSAFDTLFEQLTAVLIYALDGAGGVIGIGSASAGAV